jgi:hypothetical protein
MNVGCLAFLAVGLTTLLWVQFHLRLLIVATLPSASPIRQLTPSRTPDSAGYPLIDYFTRPKQDTQGGYNLGGINATGESIKSGSTEPFH